MGLTRLIGLDHLPEGGTYGALATGYGFALTDLAMECAWTNNTSSYPNIFCGKVKSGWLNFGTPMAAASGNCAGAVTIPWGKLIGAVDPNRVFLGVRVDKLRAPTTTIPLVSAEPVSALAAAATSSYTPVNIFLSHAAADALGEAYYEFELNFNTRKYNVWKDDVLFVSEGTIPAAVTKTSLKNFHWQVGSRAVYHGPNGVDINTVRFRDIYVMVDLGAPGDDQMTRLGPIRLTKLRLDPVTGTDWTASAGTLVDVVNAPKTAANLTTPNAASGAAKGPLVAKIAPGQIEERRVIGVAITTTAFRGVTDSGNLNVTVKNGSTSELTKVVPLTSSTNGFDSQVGLITKLSTANPTAATWEGLEITLTPTE